MAVPKRKKSRSRTRHRRAQWKTQATDLTPIAVDGQVHRIPRRLARAAHLGLLDG